MPATTRRRVWLGGTVLAAIALACVAPACNSTEKPAPTPFPPAGRLQSDTGVPWVVDVDPQTGVPDLLLPLGALPPVAAGGGYEQAARAFLAKYGDLYGMTDPALQLALEEVTKDADDYAHVSFRQRERGVVVDGTRLVVHFLPSGAIALVTGAFVPSVGGVPTQPTLTEDAAILAAEADARAAYPGYERKWLAAPPTAALVLAQRGATATLAYLVRLDAFSPAATFSRAYRIDAITGAVVDVYDDHETLVGSGVGVLGDTKSFEVDERFLVSGYNLLQRSSSTRSEVSTYSYGTGWFGWDSQIISDQLTSWDTGGAGAGAGVDAHKYIAESDRYYRVRHGYRSYDGWGSAIKVIVHENTKGNQNNAYWDNRGGIHFNDGDVHTGGSVRPTSAAADVVGHELTHGVTQHTSGLRYAGQSGALNESLSDIFGAFIELDSPSPGSNLTLVGESAWSGGLRSFPHPGTKGQPDHMRNEQAAGATPTKDNDWGGVHGNSGIPNNAFYLMTVGGTNDTSQIPVTRPIGFRTSRLLWWLTQRFTLNSGSTFDQAARLQTAWSWLLRSHETVGCAWVATGVLTPKYMKDTYNVSCFCETADGGVQQPADMPCCDAGAAGACCKVCTDAAAPDAGPSDAGDAGPVDPPSSPSKPELADSCRGRADGVYCSQLAAYSSIVCKQQSIAGGLQCANMAKCLGPNGPGAQVECEGQPRPTTAPDAGPPPPAPIDSCSGKPDGIYCSIASPFSAYVCRGGSTAGGAQCPSPKSCTGPNGPGSSVVCN